MVARAQDTALIIQSEPGDPIGGGQQLTLTAPDWQFTTDTYYTGRVAVSAGSGSQTYSLGIEMPWYGVLRPGVYPVTSADDRPFGSPWLGIYVGQGYYDRLDGTFEIRR
jgi:hypothetical protein